MYQALELAQNNGADIIIISDANSFYISTIAKAKGIDQFIKHVITNPAETNMDRLSIKRHSIDAHSCTNGCAVNLCKGRELLKYFHIHI